MIKQTNKIMVNSFKSVLQAKFSWSNDNAWEYERNKYKMPKSVAVCFIKDEYVIVTGKHRIKYREDHNQIKEYLV